MSFREKYFTGAALLLVYLLLYELNGCAFFSSVSCNLNCWIFSIATIEHWLDTNYDIQKLLNSWWLLITLRVRTSHSALVKHVGKVSSGVNCFSSICGQVSSHSSRIAQFWNSNCGCNVSILLSVVRLRLVCSLS